MAKNGAGELHPLWTPQRSPYGLRKEEWYQESLDPYKAPCEGYEDP
jgi:hypothetical protein